MNKYCLSLDQEKERVTNIRAGDSISFQLDVGTCSFMRGTKRLYVEGKDKFDICPGMTLRFDLALKFTELIGITAGLRVAEITTEVDRVSIKLGSLTDAIAEERRLTQLLQTALRA